MGGSTYVSPTADSFVCRLMSLVATCSAEPGCWDCSSSVDATNRSSGNRHIEPIGQILRPWLDVLELGDDVTRDKDPFAHIAIGTNAFESSIRALRGVAHDLGASGALEVVYLPENDG